ncbi:hypothetical protein LMH73_011690 [Vibrio splendidus]|nr:hypothetical protein [Vibrio splendidus]MCC4883307.1 hypothetical protein [Vibrio splendidus]
MNTKKPSDYRGYPFASVTKTSECETVARNIMTMMQRNGDEFQLITPEIYRAERLKNGATDKAVDRELPFYNRVIDYMVSPESVEKFCPSW